MNRELQPQCSTDKVTFLVGSENTDTSVALCGCGRHFFVKEYRSNMTGVSKTIRIVPCAGNEKSINEEGLDV